MDISKDAKALLLLMYKRYQAERKSGKPKRDAVYFGSAQQIAERIMPKEMPEDVLDYLCELKREGFVSASLGDNSLWDCALTDRAISAIEKIPAETIKSVANFIGNFVP